MELKSYRILRQWPHISNNLVLCYYFLGAHLNFVTVSPEDSDSVWWGEKWFVLQRWPCPVLKVWIRETNKHIILMRDPVWIHRPLSFLGLGSVCNSGYPKALSWKFSMQESKETIQVKSIGCNSSTGQPLFGLSDINLHSVWLPNYFLLSRGHSQTGLIGKKRKCLISTWY